MMISFTKRNDRQQNVYVNGKYEGVITLTKLKQYTLISSLYRCPNTMTELPRYVLREIRQEAKKKFATGTQ